MAPLSPGEHSLPGMTSALSEEMDAEPCLSFGDLFQTLAELLPHEVSLCSDALQSCRVAERLASVPIGFLEASDVCDSLNRLLDAQHFARGAECRASVKPLQDLAQRIARVASMSGPGQGVAPAAQLEAAVASVAPTIPTREVASRFDLIQQENGAMTKELDVLPQAKERESEKTAEPKRDSEKSAWRSLPFFPDKSHGGFRVRVFKVLDDGSQSLLGKGVAFIMMIAIAVSTVAYVLESMPYFRERPEECYRLRDANLELTIAACEPTPRHAFYVVEAVCIIIFSIDYLLRVGLVHATCEGFSEGMLRTVRYSVELLNIIDLIAVLPFYIGLVVNTGSVRILRLARILRLFKMARHNSGILLIADVMVMSGEPLLILLFFNIIITVLFGSLIFYAEGQRFSVSDEFLQTFPQGVYVRLNQEHVADEPTPFRSIPFSIWWVFVTMTTVGYGDYSPTTTTGKFIGVISFYVGVIFLALPISIIGNNFEIAYDNMVKRSSRIDQNDIAKQRRESRRLRDEKENMLKAERSEIGMPLIPVRSSVRKSIFTLLEDPSASLIGKIWSIFMILVILVSTVAFILESMPYFNSTPAECVEGNITVEACQPRPRITFSVLEVTSIVIFTADYVLRVGTVHTATAEECGVEVPQRWPSDSGLLITALYAFQAMNIIDLIAIVPFYVSLAGGGGGGAAVLRVLRLVRIFRVLKMPKLRACAEMLIDTVIDAFPALVLVFIMTMLMCVLLASLIVFAEGSTYSVTFDTVNHPYGTYIRPTYDHYDMEASKFRSIPYAFWWFFTTATTVGYGDDYPTTFWGRVVGVFTFYTGIILLALPITVVGGCFNKHYPEWVKQFSTDSVAAAVSPRKKKGPLTCAEKSPVLSDENHVSTDVNRLCTPGGQADSVEKTKPSESDARVTTSGTAWAVQES